MFLYDGFFFIKSISISYVWLLEARRAVPGGNGGDGDDERKKERRAKRHGCQVGIFYAPNRKMGII